MGRHIYGSPISRVWDTWSAWVLPDGTGSGVSNEGPPLGWAGLQMREYKPPPFGRNEYSQVRFSGSMLNPL